MIMMIIVVEQTFWENEKNNIQDIPKTSDPWANIKLLKYYHIRIGKPKEMFWSKHVDPLFALH